MTNKERSVEEIESAVANIRFITDDILSYSPDGEIATLCHEARKQTDIMETALQAERKKREEMVEAIKDRLTFQRDNYRKEGKHIIDYMLNYLSELTQTNNPK